MRAFRRVTENNTLIPGILRALAYYPEQVYAMQVKAEAGRGQRLVVPKGTADILGTARRPDLGRVFSLHGIPFAIETKASHGTECQRKGCSCIEQRVWRARWEKCGGLYVLATTVQQAVDGVLGGRAAA